MSLKNLIALQKQKAATQDAPPAKESPAEAESKRADPPRIGLGLNRAKKLAPAGPPKAEPKPAPTQLAEGFSLEDLAALDTAEISEPEPENHLPQFEDEIEATAPDRELPADLTPEMNAFIESLDGMYQVVHDPEMFGQTVRIIMQELQENKEYERLLSDNDVHVMIRGMRRTMGLARVKKQSKKRGESTKKNARKESSKVDHAMALLATLTGGATE